LHPGVDARKIQVLPEAGGWSAVLDRFNKDHAPTMRKFAEGRFLLLLDFDEAPDRLEVVRAKIPEDLRERVFVLGVRTEPEALRAKLGISLESIGSDLAKDCALDTYKSWSHELLAHNVGELERLRASVRPFLFA
jgi:hypothetical protein